MISLIFLVNKLEQSDKNSKKVNKEIDTAIIFVFYLAESLIDLNIEPTFFRKKC